MKQKQWQPIPQGKYLPAIRNNNIIYTSGMTPRKAGKLIYSGEIKMKDQIDTHKEAVQLAALNALIAANSCLQEGEKIGIILQLNVFLNVEKGFVAHAELANFATDVFIENLGEKCIGSRAAIGVSTLPSNAPVEITLTALVN